MTPEVRVPPRADFGTLRDYLAPGVVDAFDAVVASGAGRPQAEIWPQVIAAISQGRDLMLSRCWRYDSANALPVLLNEILCRQDYYFDIAEPAPRIIDAGANIGLASYYFHRTYHGCRLDLIEPNPVLCDILQGNLDRNGFAGATLHRAALYDRETRLPFHVSKHEDPASSLLDERAPADAEVIEVPTLDIRALLAEPASLLKLDIEGAEATVLAAAGDLLRNVGAIFCETHAVAGGNTLPEVLRILTAAGFDWAVTRSPLEETEPRLRFARWIGRRRSYSVFARRRPD